MKIIVLLGVSLLLTGCVAGKTGGVRETVTSKVDGRGMVTEQVTTTESVGTSKYSEYSRTVPEVVRAISDADVARTQAIVSMSQPSPGESPDVAPYKGAMALLALTQTKADYASALQAIHYGQDGFDLGSQGLGILGSVAKMGVITYGATKIIDKVVDGAGDKINISGDGNETSFEKVNVNSTTRASAWGDNSPADANSNANPSAPGSPPPEVGGQAALDAAFDKCTANGAPLGDTMTCISAATGQIVDLNGSTVTVNGTPWQRLQTYGQAQIDEQKARGVR